MNYPSPDALRRQAEADHREALRKEKRRIVDKMRRDAKRMAKVKGIVIIQFEIGANTPEELHEALCQAFHEYNLDPIIRLKPVHNITIVNANPADQGARCKSCGFDPCACGKENY